MAAHSLLKSETVASGTDSYSIPWDEFDRPGNATVTFILRGDHTEELELLAPDADGGSGASLYVPAGEPWQSGGWSEDKRSIKTIERAVATAFTISYVLEQ